MIKEIIKVEYIVAFRIGEKWSSWHQKYNTKEEAKREIEKGSPDIEYRIIECIITREIKVLNN